MSSKEHLSFEIQTIFEKNKIDDLHVFLNKRRCLNKTNSYFIYLFYLFQSIGILTTSIATGTNHLELIWIGITLNILASLINIYEKINSMLLKKLMKDIQLIKENHYIDEGEWINADELTYEKENMPKQINNNTTNNI
jgi:hypothetical protein